MYQHLYKVFYTIILYFFNIFSGIVNYMIKQTEEASKVFLRLKQVQDYMKKDKLTVIGFFESVEDKRVDILVDVGM